MMQPRLTTLKPRLTPTAPANEAERSQIRRDTMEWRRWYGLAEWKKLALSCKIKACFTCARCKRMDAGPGAMVADHIRPHRGDRDLFFDAANLQCLCKPCHDKDKQSEERRGWHG